MPSTFGRDRQPIGPRGRQFIYASDHRVSFQNETEDTVEVVICSSDGHEWTTVYVDKVTDQITRSEAWPGAAWEKFTVEPKGVRPRHRSLRED